LPADYTFQPSDSGAVTFPNGVTLITPGDETLTVTDTASGITGSATVTITSPAVPPRRGRGYYERISGPDPQPELLKRGGVQDPREEVQGKKDGSISIWNDAVVVERRTIPRKA
jgi:hypothetical protein